MPDLSSELRDYFDSLVESITSPVDGDLPLTPEPPQRSRRRYIVASSVVAACIVAILGLTVRNGGLNDEVRTIDEPPTATAPVPSFDDLAPGWHPLETGPVPPMASANLVWTGTELVVIGNEVGGGYLAFAFDSVRGAWRELPPLPDQGWSRDGTPGLAWTGDELLVVESSAQSPGAAVWDPGTDTWEILEGPPLAAPLQSFGSGMRSRGPWGGAPALVWTGETVLDLTHGAVWSPVTREWSELAMPDDLIPYIGLLYTTPVLVNREVIAAPWSTSPGLIWDASGTEFREAPGMPAEIAEEGVTNDALATAVGDRVFVISGTQDGRTASFDPQTNTWYREPDLHDARSEGCPIGVTSVAGWVIAQSCWTQPTVALDHGESMSWRPIDEDECCNWLGAEWVDADGILITWSTSTDTFNSPGAPYVRAGVWVPPGRTTASEPPSRSDPRIGAECPPVELSGEVFEQVQDLEGWPLVSSPVEQLHSLWRRPGEPGVISAALPGSTAVGDGFDLVEALTIGEFDATLAPNVHHSPEPWRLMVFLPFDQPGCGWMTIMAWEGAGRDALLEFAQQLTITVP